MVDEIPTIDGPHYEAHHDWEGVDEIVIRQIPRFKTSELSGDCWRVSAVIVFKRKGVIVYERAVHHMGDAVKFLPWIMDAEMAEQNKFPRGIFGHYPDECAQPGCSAPAVNHYRIKEKFAQDGHGPLKDYKGDCFRAFCRAHTVRGDASREDNDENYALVKGDGKGLVSNDDVSPSVFGGII